MKYILPSSLTILGLLALASGLFYIASTRPYVEPRAIDPSSLNSILASCRVGGGYYNEGFIWIGVVCIAAVVVITIATLITIYEMRNTNG